MKLEYHPLIHAHVLYFYIQQTVLGQGPSGTFSLPIRDTLHNRLGIFVDIVTSSAEHSNKLLT
jgi:hypothetical protein